MNTITLRSGRELEDPLTPMREEKREADNEEDHEKEAPIVTPSERIYIERTQEVQAEHVSLPVKPYKPPNLYPQRLLKANEE